MGGIFVDTNIASYPPVVVDFVVVVVIIGADVDGIDSGTGCGGNGGSGSGDCSGADDDRGSGGGLGLFVCSLYFNSNNVLVIFSTYSRCITACDKVETVEV